MSVYQTKARQVLCVFLLATFVILAAWSVSADLAENFEINMSLLYAKNTSWAKTMVTVRDVCIPQLEQPTVTVGYWYYTLPRKFKSFSESRVLDNINLNQLGPDGTEQAKYYGSNLFWPNSTFYACPIPDNPTKVVGIFDNMLLLKEVPGYVLLEPVPMRKTQRSPMVPDKVKLNKQDANVYMVNVYNGRGLQDVPRGTARNCAYTNFTTHTPRWADTKTSRWKAAGT